jgi:hypothetical protein
MSELQPFFIYEMRSTVQVEASCLFMASCASIDDILARELWPLLLRYIEKEFLLPTDEKAKAAASSS